MRKKAIAEIRNNGSNHLEFTFHEEPVSKTWRTPENLSAAVAWRERRDIRNNTANIKKMQSATMEEKKSNFIFPPCCNDEIPND